MQNKKEVNGLTYEREAIKTRLLNFGDNLFEAIQDYVIPQKQNGDWLAISEKVVSVCQNNARHISSVKAGFLAKLIVRFVKKYPKTITVFSNFKVDSCCGGGASIEKTAGMSGVDINALLKALNQAALAGNK